MNIIGRRFALHSRLAQSGGITVGLLLSVLLGAAGGCQARKEVMSPPARVLYDSLIAAHEFMFNATDPKLGYSRMGCVYEQAVSTLGRDEARRISSAAEAEVRSRHSLSEAAAVSHGLQGDYPFATPEVCREVDSLWYARFVPNAKVPHKP